MKRTLISIAAALGFSIVTSAVLLAQSVTAVYHVPFSFNAAGVQLPAGKYTVQATGPQASLLSGYGGGFRFITSPNLSGKPSPAHLTFYKHGNAYFLREVWQQNGTGTKIRVSEQEREMMRAELVAKNAATPVLIAATH